ncbi:50S ribosomal protein L3 [Candidatus Thermoflexus japonica]|uniref:Large ribosomal subunit protein uL3 n=1 Tax=Candidatus Thermoflexus japonica TaxID=2035417 RepID=A0A2H5Y875_9CHLR|nr:50S ribosomal protein L3 [Candidatus Thermoflexus japonica]
MKGLLARKIGMTQMFTEQGEVVPVTVLRAGPCYVTQLRTPERDGYAAIQLGFEETRPRRLTQGELGHLLKRNLPPLRVLREIRLPGPEALAAYQEGQVLTVAIFSPGERVDVTGWSKGRGFAGGIKRHGFARQAKTHGQSDRHRAPGSIGTNTDPGRVVKGKRMAGHYGNERVTVRNLQVVWVDPERHLIALKGAVPGPRGGLVMIRQAKRPY